MDIASIKKQLPHGALKEIAIRSNYSKSSISQFFNGKFIPLKSAKILKVTAEVLRDHKIREKEAINELNKVLEL